MPLFIDQLQQNIQLPSIPKRIVSLVPSQTELLFHLGLQEEVVGITKFCIHPHKWFTTKAIIGGTKNINIKKIQQLKPDLIIANKEENVKAQIEALQAFCPVWVSDVNNLQDALNMINSIGIITGKELKAESLMQEIQNNFNQLTTYNLPPKTAYLIWRNPYITIGGNTFINDMLQRCGFENVFANQSRYPQIEINQLATSNCQLILLSSEPYPFKQKHIDELQSQMPNHQFQIELVDGEMFSWYGSRLLQAPAYFQSLIQKIKT